MIMGSGGESWYLRARATPPDPSWFYIVLDSEEYIVYK